MFNIKKKLKIVNVNDLKPYPGNPRRNNKSAKVVAKSIKQYGYINPIIVNPDLVVLAGNTRLKALKILKIKEIDVIVVSGLTKEQEAGFVIADNRVGEYSSWNYAQIDRMVSSDDCDKTLINELGMTSFKGNKQELEKLIDLDIHAKQ